MFQHYYGWYQVKAHTTIAPTPIGPTQLVHHHRSNTIAHTPKVQHNNSYTIAHTPKVHQTNAHTEIGQYD